MADYNAIKTLKVGSGSVVIEGISYAYDIISAKLEPRVPNFVGFPDSEYLFISEEVPEKYRYPMLAHEVRCFALKDAGHAGHCKAAVAYELTFVSGNEKRAYLAFRREFFEKLVSYYEQEGKTHAPFIPEIRASRDFLQTIA